MCEPIGPGDHQADDCCVNPQDQEITRRMIVAESVCEHGMNRERCGFGGLERERYEQGEAWVWRSRMGEV